MGRDRCLNRFLVFWGRKMGHAWLLRRQPKRGHSTSKDHSREQQRQKHKDRYGTGSKEVVSCTKKWTNGEAEALLSSPGSAIHYCLALHPTALSQASMTLLTELPPFPQMCCALPRLSALVCAIPSAWNVLIPAVNVFTKSQFAHL